MSKRDETHPGMSASPFISLFSGIHLERLMESADRGGEISRYEWLHCEREGKGGMRKWRRWRKARGRGGYKDI